MAARETVLRTLCVPRCAREVRERTGLPRKTIEGVLMRLLRAGLVACLTPTLRQARVYALSPLGQAWAAELLHQVDRRETPSVPSSHSTTPFPSSNSFNADDPSFWAVHGWVQAGRYRRLVVRHLAELATARQLRRRILLEYQRVGLNHVRATLRELAERGVCQRADGLWSLTELGRRLQAVDRLGLPERPCVQVWTRA